MHSSKNSHSFKFLHEVTMAECGLGKIVVWLYLVSIKEKFREAVFFLIKSFLSQFPGVLQETGDLNVLFAFSMFITFIFALTFDANYGRSLSRK